MELNFEDLENDKKIQEKLTNLHNSINKVEMMLEKLHAANMYDDLPKKLKVDYDLFSAYTLNTLYWIYLRMNNSDPNKNSLKHQINRVKEFMIKSKQVNDRLTLRPKINKAAAGRFIKHGINYKKDENNPNRTIILDD